MITKQIAAWGRRRPVSAIARRRWQCNAGESLRKRSRFATRILSAAISEFERMAMRHGRNERRHVTYARFERARAKPDEVVVIHYDSYEHLVARGVIRTRRAALPTGFPGQFVPDPR